MPAVSGTPSDPLGEGVLLSRAAPDKGVLLAADGEPISEIDLVDAPAPRGRQLFFRCPVSRVLCRVLYLSEGRVGTAAALGLAYDSSARSQMQRAEIVRDALVDRLENPRLAKAKRQTLLRRLQGAVRYLRGTAGEDWAGPLAIEDQRALLKRGRPRTRAVNVHPLSTEAGLVEGRRNRLRLTSSSICRQLDFMVHAGLERTTVTPTRQFSLGPADDYPVLDIRALRSGQGRAAGVRLIWWKSGAGSVNARLRIDDARDRVLVRIDEAGDAKPRFSILKVVRGNRPGDRFLICPELGTRHLRLHYRQGRFACMAAQNLMTPTEWTRWQQTLNRHSKADI